jgi:2-polyprenyl-3-methyl-5-hydroxy-6-metoxy-1,4-benzoquinol methylase
VASSTSYPAIDTEIDPARDAFRKARRAHWDSIARRGDLPTDLGGYYHRRLTEVYQFLVPPGRSVIELGCACGDLLAALQPARGVGVDFSPEAIGLARSRHPSLRFIESDVQDLDLDAQFDVVILSDLVNDLWDVQAVFDKIGRLSHPRTRVILNSYSRLWELPLGLAKRLNLAKPTLHQNWLAVADVTNLLNLTDFEVITHWSEVIWPVWTPLVADFCNRVLARVWPFTHLALSNFIVARPKPQARASEPTVSVIVPARNESGNIRAIFSRTPNIGAWTELVFVEGHSKDDTYAAIEGAIAEHPHQRCQLLKQTGAGKGDAVREGFQKARGDVLMILDADLTVPPEDLPRFYAALCSGKGEFINGVRLVYPMEKQAMRFVNLLGNKFFTLAFSWLLDQSVKDTLCGTKVLWRSDYELIAANRAYFGDFDPFGDFDLLFGAAKLSLKISDLPVRYRERTYGSTNIQRWTHGWLLLKMIVFAARRLKFR